MVPIVQQDTSRRLSETQIGGWISRQITRLKNSFVGGIITSIPMVSGYISLIEKGLAMDILPDISESSVGSISSYSGGVDPNTFWRLGDGVLTPSDTAVLDKWDEEKLFPFLRGVLLNLDEAFKNDTLLKQIEAVNDIIPIVYGVKKHFIDTPDTSLSVQGNKFKNDYIDSVFQPLIQFVKSKFSPLGVIQIRSTEQMSDFDFGNLIMRSSVTSFSAVIYKTAGVSPLSDALPYVSGFIVENASIVGGSTISEDYSQPHESVVIPNDDESELTTKTNYGTIAAIIFGLAVLGSLVSGKKQKVSNQ